MVAEVCGEAAMDDGAGGVEWGGLEVESGGAHLGAFEREDWESS